MNDTAPKNTMSSQQFVADTCMRLDEFECVSKRDWRLVVRRPWPGRSAVIVKLWARPDAKGVMRRLFRISSAYYEWRNLRLLYELGIRVPVPIAMVNMPDNSSGYTEALVMEDLGVCEEAVRYLSAAIAAGDDKRVWSFEEQIIEITAAMIRGKVLDWDHGLINIVATPAGEAVRLDLEQARRVFSLRWNQDVHGRMLGMLLSTYTFAVQPDVARVSDFAARLFAALSPSRTILRLTQEWLNKGLARQHNLMGVDTRVELPIGQVRSSVK